jgi:hypothetical protein
MSTTPEIIDLDDYERRKLGILTFEKMNTLMFSFAFVIVLAFVAYALVDNLHDIYIIATTRPPRADRMLRARLLFLAQLPVLVLIVYAAVYYARASAQARPRPMRWARIAVVPFIVAVGWYIYVTPGLQDLYVFAWRLYTAHWATSLELVLFVVLGCLAIPAQIKQLRGSLAMARMSEGDKIFLRDDAEQGFLRGRALRTLLGIPRIVDLMPRRRLLVSVAFVLANFFFALSLAWPIVYLVFFSYRWIVMMEYHGGALDDPYIADTAVMHLVASMSASVLAFVGGPFIGGHLLAFVRSNVRWSVDELLEADERAPILFLRAFKDDQVQLGDVKLTLIGRAGRWLEVFANLDRLLLEEATPYGPVVAIGNPSDRFPPYGAARGYFDDKTWQAAVSDLARRARAIVVCIDRTEGVWWEVGHIASLGYLAKTLFLVHPKYGAAPENPALAAEIARELRLADGLPHLATVGEGRAPGLLGFFVDPDGRLRIGGSTTFSRLAFLIMVRWFLRTKLGFAGPAS